MPLNSMAGHRSMVERQTTVSSQRGVSLRLRVVAGPGAQPSSGILDRDFSAPATHSPDQFAPLQMKGSKTNWRRRRSSLGPRSSAQIFRSVIGPKQNHEINSQVSNHRVLFAGSIRIQRFNLRLAIKTHFSEEFMKLTPGKLAGLKKVSTDRGVIAAAAMDQRGSLQKSLAKEKGSANQRRHDGRVQVAGDRSFTPHASAILLDPEWGLPASKRRAKNAGLLLAYEKTGYDKTGPGRLPDLLNHWSAKRLKEAGADCVKILLYYTPLIRKKSTIRSTPGSSVSATSAAPTISHTSWNS